MGEAGVTDEAQQRYLAVAMHALGDILYYSDDPDLEQTVVLRPDWVNKYISLVLDSKPVDEARGLLTHGGMTHLWSSLDRGMRDHFLSMMDKYEISFRVDGGKTGVVSLVVERLPWNPPPFEDEWERLAQVPGNQEIRVRYQLNTMPPRIPTWFIARSHRFTTGAHWRTGALLAHPDGVHKALLRAQRARNTVELTVRGPHPAAFFSVLDDGFNQTLLRYPGLEINRLDPCRCGEGCSELFDYKDLQRRLHMDPPRHDMQLTGDRRAEFPSTAACWRRRAGTVPPSPQPPPSCRNGHPIRRLAAARWPGRRAWGSPVDLDGAKVA